MAGISFPGLGSGLQVSEIVNAIVGAEKAPFEARLMRQQASYTTDISAVGSLKGALEDVKNALEDLGDVDKYRQRNITGRDDFVSLSSNKDAQVGSYSVKVDALATAHKLMSGAFDGEEAVGEGKLTIASGDDSFDIDVSDTATLADIRDAINDSSDNNSVAATIITDESGQHLVLTSKETGVANEITITVDDIGDGNPTDGNGLSRLAYDPGAATPITNLTEVEAASDAKITIDGTIVVSNSTNEFSNVIDGIDITVKKAHGVDDDLSRLKVTEDNGNVASGIESFIEKFNSLVDLSKQLGKSGEDGNGALSGDALLRGVMTKLRSELSHSHDVGGGDTFMLTQLGVHTERNGHLSFDKDELDDLQKLDPQKIQNFFAGEDGESGFVGKIDSFITVYTDSDGLIQQRIQGNEAHLDRLDKDATRFGEKMASLESRLFAQYNAMDLLVAQMNSTSTYLQGQLDNLPGVVKKSK